LCAFEGEKGRGSTIARRIRKGERCRPFLSVKSLGKETWSSSLPPPPAAEEGRKKPTVSTRKVAAPAPKSRRKRRRLSGLFLWRREPRREGSKTKNGKRKEKGKGDASSSILSLLRKWEGEKKSGLTSMRRVASLSLSKQKRTCRIFLVLPSKYDVGEPLWGGKERRVKSADACRHSLPSSQ